MQLPQAMYDICANFDRHFKDDILNDEDWIDFAIHRLNHSQKTEAINFLEAILSEPLSDKNLEDVWFNSCARFGFEPNTAYREIFNEMRRRLKGEKPSFSLQPD